MRFQKDAKRFRNCAAGQLQVHQLFTEDLDRLRVDRTTERLFIQFLTM